MVLVSVIIVTYNSENTIIETLESIKNQTYTQLELIISDDYSQDQTITIVKNWLKENAVRFEHVRILSARHNRGVTMNCNIGINQARGKYVQLWSGDDILLENAIEEKIKFAQKYSLDCVYCKTEPFGKNVKKVNDMKRLCERGYNIIKKGWREQNNEIVLDNFIAGPSGGFYLKEFFCEFGGYDIRYPMLEDYPFVYHYVTSGHEIYLLDEVLSRYRVSGTSLSTSNNLLFRKSCRKFFFLERLPELLRRHMFKEAECQFKNYLE